jgi:copper(I)-binding protein
MRRRLFLLAPLSLTVLRATRAEAYRLGRVEIDHPWARPSVTAGAAVFVNLANTGNIIERLVGGTTPVAQQVFLRDEDGTALDSLALMPHRLLALGPGRKYIGLHDLNRPLALEDSFPLTLRFETMGEITVTVQVQDGPES